MKYFWIIWGLCVSLFANEAPTYECLNENTVYRVFQSEEQVKVEVQEGAKKQTFQLSALTPPDPRIKNAPELLTFYGQGFSEELSIRQSVDKTGTKTLIGLTLNSVRRKLGNCKAQNISLAVAPLEFKPSLEENIELLQVFSSLRKKTGILTPWGVEGVAEAIRRVNIRGDNYKVFLEESTPSLQNLDKGSIPLISKTFSGASAKLWEKMLREVRYDYYPDASRCSNWIKEGIKSGDLDSVVAGLNFFSKLPAMKSKDLKNHFVSEIQPALKNLTEEKVSELNAFLTNTARTLLNETWAVATGMKTIANFPLLNDILKDLSVLLQKSSTEINAQKLEKKILSFYRSSLSGNEDAKRIFQQNAKQLLKVLTPRQKEDLMAWVEESEKPLIRALLD